METKEKDKKYSVILGIMILLFLIVVGITIAWGLGYIHFGKQNKSSEISKEDVNIPNTNNEVTNNVDNTNQAATNNANILKSAYEKYDLEWASKIQSETEYIENNVIKIKVQDKEFDVAFNYGTVKYVCGLPGQAFDGISVVTEEGEAYIGMFNDDKFYTTFTKVDITDKIVDISSWGGKGAVIYSGPYYMTESGKVIDRNGFSYEQINKNHIDYVGTPALLVYICDDDTIDIPRTNNEYIKIIDDKGKNIKAKQLFMEDSTGYEKVYLVNEENKLYKLEINSNGVAYEEFYNENKLVTNVVYDKNKSKMKVEFNDNSNLEVSDVFVAYDLENSTYMQ